MSKNKNMKNLKMGRLKSAFQGLIAVAIIAIGLGLLVEPPKAEAQQYTVTTLLATNNMPFNVTNSLQLTNGNYIAVTKDEEVALSISFNALASSTANAYFGWKMGVDTNSLSTTGTSMVTNVIPANGLTTVNFVTNMYMGAIGYLAIDAIGNNSGSVSISNIVIKVATKPKLRL